MMHPFEIAAEPVRRRIIEVLAVGDHAVGTLNEVIAAEFSISRSAVSHHLRILRDQGVVVVQPDEALPQSRLYRLDETFLERLDDAVGELYRLWDHRYGTVFHRAPIHPAIASRAPHRHRAGRKGQRGRTASDAADLTGFPEPE
ncbi:ArsR/SmtB family transcription factor [Agromyces ramosus]|uniref:DNA-binding transcriptional ArsR family regulator n=1 Tax=Agromyces ramosus TaxID=33879 RepID=A0ABU0RAR6_9MICO|nr:metalloregulator ArsR/SmtB family transcription factor [Agromyces ramosus]MDQ0894296.1 DNA-binding transcriptional ArsR family regulator [Agromyces ramosus]